MSGNGLRMNSSYCAARTQIRANGRAKTTPGGVHTRESSSFLEDTICGLWICMSWFESMSPSHNPQQPSDATPQVRST